MFERRTVGWANAGCKLDASPSTTYNQPSEKFYPAYAPNPSLVSVIEIFVPGPLKWSLMVEGAFLNCEKVTDDI